MLSIETTLKAREKNGHRVIGEIATQNLTRQTFKVVNEILGGQSLALVSTWADEMKSNSEFDKYSPWHYVNIPLDKEYNQIEKNPKGDIIQAINKCNEVLEEMIEKFPNATITALENGNEFGKTSAKAYYLIVQCYIGLDDIQKAESYIPVLEKYTNTYVVINSEKFSFAQLAKELITKYNLISCKNK